MHAWFTNRLIGKFHEPCISLQSNFWSIAVHPWSRSIDCNDKHRLTYRTQVLGNSIYLAGSPTYYSENQWHHNHCDIPPQ